MLHKVAFRSWNARDDKDMVRWLGNLERPVINGGAFQSEECVAWVQRYKCFERAFYGIPARKSVRSFKPQAVDDESCTVALRMSRTYLPSKVPRHALCITHVLSCDGQYRA
jgi:hypothetical protein